MKILLQQGKTILLNCFVQFLSLKHSSGNFFHLASDIKKDKNLLNFFFFLLGFVHENCLYFILLGKKSLLHKKNCFPICENILLI